MTINASRNADPHRRPGAARRASDPLYPVWGPDGRLEMHPRHVVNDLVRFGTVEGTWYSSDPAEMARALPAHLVNQDAVRQRTAAAAAQASMEDSATPVVNPRLNALRTEITELGGQFQPTWGIRSLERHLAAIKSELAESREFNVKDPTAGKSLEQLQAAVTASADAQASE